MLPWNRAIHHTKLGVWPGEGWESQPPQPYGGHPSTHNSATPEPETLSPPLTNTNSPERKSERVPRESAEPHQSSRKSNQKAQQNARNAKSYAEHMINSLAASRVVRRRNARTRGEEEIWQCGISGRVDECAADDGAGMACQAAKDEG